jgi:hypothetical protein
LLIVFALAGDSTMTRFLDIVRSAQYQTTADSAAVEYNAECQRVKEISEWTPYFPQIPGPPSSRRPTPGRAG